MPRNPTMRTRAEVESALRFARDQYEKVTQEYREAEPHSCAEEAALAYRKLWAGRIDGYRYVLYLDGDALETCARCVSPSKNLRDNLCPACWCALGADCSPVKLPEGASTAPDPGEQAGTGSKENS